MNQRDQGERRGQRWSRTVRDVSAGGVVFRQGDSSVEIALVGRRNPALWALPKGTPQPREALEQTAVRETQEETGLVVRLVCPILEINYWFVLGGRRHLKTVHFYLMEAVGGDRSLHDAEYDVVEWVPLSEALQKLSYANEAQVVQRAAELLRTIHAA